MKASPLLFLTLLLALTTAGAGALAWHQHAKLQELQAVAARNAAERADWLERIAAIERLPLSAPVEAQAADAAAEIAPVEGQIEQRRGGPMQAGGPDRRRANPLATLMQDPAFAQAMMVQQKGALDHRYADLFRRLNLTPAQIDQFKSLLVERQSAASDVMTAARDQGLDGRETRDELRKLVESTQGETDERIRAFLGEAAYNEYKTYEQTQVQRTFVGQLENKLSYTGSPLQGSQADQLVRILAEASGQAGRGGAGPGNFFIAGGGGFAAGAQVVGGGGGGGPVRITDEVIARAQSVLNQSQLEGLKQMQAEQQAQRAIGDAMREASREANRNNRGGPQGGSVTVTAP